MPKIDAWQSCRRADGFSLTATPTGETLLTAKKFRQREQHAMADKLDCRDRKLAG
jgi:hypothetical protein